MPCSSALCACTVLQRTQPNRSNAHNTGLLEANGIMDVKLIVNRVRPDMIAKNDMMSVRDVQVREYARRMRHTHHKRPNPHARSLVRD